MPFRLYENSGLTSLVTLEDVFSNPDDEDDIDGDAGATVDKALWVSSEQTTLNGGINAAVTSITLTAARFADTGLPYAMIENEKVQITAGWGTTSLTVVRGVKGTTKAIHTDGTAIKLAYNLQSDGAVTCEDNTGTDESDWVEYAADASGIDTDTLASLYTIGALAYTASLKIWRRLGVPASTSCQSKQDLVHVVSGACKEEVTP